MMRFALLLMMGCAVAEPEEPELEVVFAPGETDQGQYLLGEGADDLLGAPAVEHISSSGVVKKQLSGAAATHVGATSSGQLVAYYDTTPPYYDTTPLQQFTGWKDLEIEVDGDRNLRIVDVINGRYVLEVVTVATGESEPYCAGDPPDNRAIAVRGSWSRQGVHNNNDRIVFSCATGVIRKCFEWGYPPGLSPGNGSNTTDLWRIHQACTRMARADYCGDGTEHTKDETTIVIRDHMTGAFPNWGLSPPARLPIATAFPTPPNQFWLEALWDPDGALCLSEERWASEPINGMCAAKLPDPRNSSAGFCEAVVDHPPKPVFFYNSSKVGLLALNIWAKGLGNDGTSYNDDFLVTVRGTAQSTFLGFNHGGQIGLLMRNPPLSLLNPPGQLAPITFQHNMLTNDYLSSTEPRMNNYDPAVTSGSVDGYVYTADTVPPSRIEVFLYMNAFGDYVMGTVSPNSATYPDANRVSLGFIDPMPVYP